METVLQPIARIYNDYSEKFGIPRQSGLVSGVPSAIVFEKKFRSRDALRGIEDYSHLWLIWRFDVPKREGFIPTVRPPRLGGNTHMGVFATRSPFRPNPLGLSCVRLIEVKKTAGQGDILIVEGADIRNGSVIFDIKPYLAYTDAKPDALSGFALTETKGRLKVIFTGDCENLLGEQKKAALTAILSQDPRPGYKTGDGRVFAFSFGGRNVSFKVEGDVLTVIKIE